MMNSKDKLLLMEIEARKAFNCLKGKIMRDRIQGEDISERVLMLDLVLGVSKQ